MIKHESSHVLVRLLLVLSICLGAPALAASLSFTLEVPDGLPGNYYVEIPVAHEGEMTIEASWSGSRILSFRVDHPDSSRPATRRSGPSPQHLSATIGADELALGTPWKLSIRALASNGAAEGTITVHLPEPVPAVEKPTVTAAAASAPAVSKRERIPPPGSPPAWRIFSDSAEQLRVELEGSSAPDSCRWQSDLLSYLDEVQVELYERGVAPSSTTGRALLDIVEVIDLVDSYESSNDPALIGPIPEDPLNKLAWLRDRKEHFLSLESELDSVMLELQSGYAPALKSEKWPLRLISCVTACERHFDQRTLKGTKNAVNLDLASSQWDKVLVAADTLKALASLSKN